MLRPSPPPVFVQLPPGLSIPAVQEAYRQIHAYETGEAGAAVSGAQRAIDLYCLYFLDIVPPAGRA